MICPYILNKSTDFSSAFYGKNECFQSTVIKEKVELAEHCLVQSHVLHLTSDRQGTILLPSSSITPIELVPGI